MIAALLLAAAVPDPAPAACSLAAPQACADVSALLALPETAAGVRAIAGDRRANYLREGLPLVADQAMEVLGGPAEKPRQIAGGWLFGACRPASCGEKGAVIVDTKGRVAAFAVLHGACGVDLSQVGCARDLSLSIWGGDDVAGWRLILADWAEREVSIPLQAIYANGESEPVLMVDGEFDGDRLADEAALIRQGSAWQLTVRRGAMPKKPVVVETVAKPDGYVLKPTPAGLLHGTASRVQRARWTGERFESFAPD